MTTRTVYANGGKTPWRQRTVRVTEDWCWPMIVSHAASQTPQARLWPLRHEAYLVQHWKALDHETLKGLPRHTLHDFRHSWAIWSLQDGMPESLVANQLGHKDTTLLKKNYGKWIVKSDDYERWFTSRTEARRHVGQ